MVGRRASPTDERCDLRKLRKPMIEKKRRERINTSIDQLKKMLTESRPEIDCETKLDKAEILELTVNQLTNRNSSPFIGNTTHSDLQTSPRYSDRLPAKEVRAHAVDNNRSYISGFHGCSNEVIQYLTASGWIDASVLSLLTTHLHVVSRKRTTHRTIVTSSMETETVCSPNPRICSTPLSRDVPSFQCNLSVIMTSPTSYSNSFESIETHISSNGEVNRMSGSDGMYSGSDRMCSGIDRMCSESDRVSSGSDRSLSVSEPMCSGSDRIYSGSDVSVGNLVSDEKLWRPW